jgi:16S rRNA processing protein RimM
MHHGQVPSYESAAGEFVTIALVTKTQGRNGEVAAALFTDFPERFSERRRLFAVNQAGKRLRRELELENHWFHKGGVVLKFVGFDSISEAESLIGCEIQIPLAERAALPGDSVFVSDLVGCTVTDSGREIGRIKDVSFGAGEAPLLVIEGEKEYLIPFAAAYIERIRTSDKRLEMRLPEGMLELDAPLTQEEKEQQKKGSE